MLIPCTCISLMRKLTEEIVINIVEAPGPAVGPAGAASVAHIAMHRLVLLKGKRELRCFAPSTLA